MSNKSFEDEDALFADIQNEIDKALKNEVLDAVKEVEIRNVRRDVFGVYTPNIYSRRGSGGIDDPENIVGEVKDGHLKVDNITTFNEGYGTANHGTGLAYMINEGGNDEHDYDYQFRGVNASYAEPRAFIDNTIDELDKSNDVENALEKGLKKTGIDLI